MKSAIVSKVLVLSAALALGIGMSGCTDFERGLVGGAVVGSGVTAAGYESGRTSGTRYSGSYYDTGYRNGCSSARGRWYKSSYNWRNFASYRNGWRAGYRRCR